MTEQLTVTGEKRLSRVFDWAKNDFTTLPESLTREVHLLEQRSVEGSLPWQQETPAPYYVFQDQVTHLYNNGFGEDIILEVQGFKDGSMGVQPISDVILPEIDEMDYDQLMKTLKAWGLESRIGFYNARIPGPYPAHRQLQELDVISHVQHLEEVGRNRISLHEFEDALSLVSQARREGHYLLSIQLAERVIDLAGRREDTKNTAATHQMLALLDLAEPKSYGQGTFPFGITGEVEYDDDGPQ